MQRRVAYARLDILLVVIAALLVVARPPHLHAEPPDADVVTVETRSVLIDTFRYEPALRLDPQAPFAPYERLDAARVGPPRAQAYHALVLRNRWLELTILPELGGRLYRLVYRPTGQDLLYRNPVVKPTIYGAQGWWLAAGGMEWAFPTDEHGYLDYVPWQARWERTESGGAVVVLSNHEQTTDLDIDVTLTLEPTEASFGVSPRTRNGRAEARRFQLWVNAMVAFQDNRVTSGTMFVLPVDRVMLHSTGEPGLPRGEVQRGTMLDWPSHTGVALDRPSAWRGSHFGAFAPGPVPFSGAHSTDAGMGLVRAPARSGSPGAGSPLGAKVFGWGPAFDRSGITDDDSDYLELWAGLTPSFWDWATIEPGEQAGWDDVWYPVPMRRPFGAANRSVALGMDETPDGPVLALYAPRPLVARVELRGEGPVVTGAVNLGPDRAVPVDIAWEHRQASELSVRVIVDRGAVILDARCHPLALRCRPVEDAPRPPPTHLEPGRPRVGARTSGWEKPRYPTNRSRRTRVSPLS